MKKTLLALLALSLTLPLAAQQSAAPAPAPAAPAEVQPPSPQAAQAWGLTETDLVADPAIRFGVLPNGMRYALMHNRTPLGQAMVRFNIDVGSLAEEEDQRGLAHFLEHMAFNGSANVPEGEMVRLLQREGLAFGQHSNASTGYEDTSYRLDLPRTTPQLIDTALMLMRETASNLTIAPDAVERERGVILAEMRDRDNYGYRNGIDNMLFSYPGARLTERDPIGLAPVISGAPAQRLRDFYARWYRPDRATLVIVGDIDVAAVEAAITRHFGDWQAQGSRTEEPDPGPFRHDRPLAADIYVHPALGETITVRRTRAQPREAPSQALRRRQLMEEIGIAIVNRRLSTLALAADAPILGAGIGESDLFDDARMLTLTASARDGQWRDALRVVENECRRALEHGFTEAEIAEQVAGLRTAYREAVAASATRQSANLANNIMAMRDGDSVFTSPASNLERVEPVLAAANPDTVAAAFRAVVAGFGAPQIRLTAKAAVEGGEAAVLAAWQAAAATPVTAPQARAAQNFAYTDFGTPGRVVSDVRVEDLDIRRIRFANNVMLNIKRTDFQDNRVAVWVRVDGGDLLAPREEPVRLALANLMTLGGLEAHSADDLRTILAGRTASMSFSSGTDSFDLSNTTTPDGLALQMQLFAAQLTAPGYRPEALTLLRRSLANYYARLDATPGAVISTQVPPIIADGDPRLMVPPMEAMMALEWAPFRAAISDALASGAIEIGIVGDVDEAAAIAAVASTLGALPERRAAFEPRTDQRVRRFAQDLAPRTLLHRGEANQAALLAYWPARDNSDQPAAIALTMLMSVVQLELTDELRERLGQSYSPGASASLSDDFPGYGTLNVGATVRPEDLPAVEASIRAIATRLRDAPVNDDLLNRARTPVLEGATAARRTNGYWLSYTARATSEPHWLDRSRQGLDLLRTLTAADVQRAAQSYLRDEAMLVIRVVPREPAAAAPAAAPSAQ